MAGPKKREKLELPSSFIASVEREKKRRRLSQNALAKLVGVSPGSLIRMRKNEGSWDTVMKVARALEIAPPTIVDANSPAARLERLRTRNPGAYAMLVRALAEGDGTDGDVRKG